MGSLIQAPELLAPAGDMERLQAAIRFGADAVYLAGKQFGMRSACANFAPDELRAAVAYAHARGVRVYVTCNIVPHPDEMAHLPQFLTDAAAAGADALIVSDLGVFRVARRVVPQMALHVSTQAGVTNAESARLFYELGARRIVPARELSLAELAAIRREIPADMEIEAFVHGAMCVSFSGRCLLSSYLTGRDSNRGDCAQPCRWRYALTEEKRPGQYFPIEEDDRGTYIMNARDLCMIDHIPELMAAGVTSFKIEGRAKSAYYVACTVNAYRMAINAAMVGRPPEPWVREEVQRISHRAYSTGFFFGDAPGQCYENGGYLRSYEVAAVAQHWADGVLVAAQRNRFFCGETLEIVAPGRPPEPLPVTALFDGDGQPIASANHAEMVLRIPCAQPVAPGALLRHVKP